MSVNLCKRCGYRWSSAHNKAAARKCPGCGTERWNTDSEQSGESCVIVGGICDICGCEFFTGILQAHYCPNCGSDKWDSGKASTGVKAATKAREEAHRAPARKRPLSPKAYHCKKCGHVWEQRSAGIVPKRCSVKLCRSTRIEEISK